MITELQNLNNLGVGIKKHWIWENKEKYSSSCDYLQKMRNTIQDLNLSLKNGLTPTNKDVIFVVVLSDWIIEAYNAIENSLKNGLLKDFHYQRDNVIEKASKYLKALRSFLVAHPLSTNRHKEYGFDGNRICIDITKNTDRIYFTKDNEWYHLGLEGLQKKQRIYRMTLFFVYMIINIMV